MVRYVDAVYRVVERQAYAIAFVAVAGFPAIAVGAYEEIVEEREQYDGSDGGEGPMYES